MQHSSLKLVLVDDHTLFRKGLKSLVELVCENVVILFEADNGTQLQNRINPLELPDIVVLDVSMPKMDGFESVEWLTQTYPSINILVVSMIASEEAIVRMLKLGVKGYLSKDVEPKELGEALRAIKDKGYYYTDFVTGKLVHSLRQDVVDKGKHIYSQLNMREKTFLEFACTELTYQEIAAKMFLSPKTIDGYRETLFEKFQVRSRVGLAMYAVKNKWIQL